MPQFWITIAIDATDIGSADDTACAMSEDVEGRVIQVVDEPPQGVQARTIPEAFALIPMRAAELGFALTNDGSGVVYTVRVVA